MPKVITRPVPDVPVAVLSDDAEPMSNDIANGLNTGRPLSEATLLVALAHYRDLAATLLISGPTFSTARVEAVKLHNKCVQRLREGAAERQRREQMARETEAGWMEIEG